MNIEFAREQMLGQQVRAWDVLDTRVIEAMRSVPREQFVPASWRDLAFADTGIPLGHGQEMMTPKVEGRMLQALAPAPRDSALEIGTGSGYVSACLGRLVARVLSLEIHDDLAVRAQARLAAIGGANVRVQTMDVFSFQPADTFDVIAVTGSTPLLEERFIKWLKPGGRLFCVVGEAPVMRALLVVRDASGEWTREALFETVVAPLVNAPRPSPFRL
jgi:protein-L-isoaspartate(D-aspartate) O-methyltransferase